MGKIADAMKKLIENSDDLSTLPQLVSQVETIEASEENYQMRIQKLQEINKSYLAQIPIPEDKTKEPSATPEEPTMEDAKNYLIEALGGK
jgi:Zn-dependent M32 family carboxypeptidase